MKNNTLQKHTTTNNINTNAKNTSSEKKTQKGFVLCDILENILNPVQQRQYAGLTDDQLVALINKGDNMAAVYIAFYHYAQAFATIVCKYYDLAGYSCRRDFACDLVAESYDCLMSGKWRKMADSKNMGSYLYCMIRNMVFQYAKKEYRHAERFQRMKDDHQIASECNTNEFLHMDSHKDNVIKLKKLMAQTGINELDRQILMLRYGHSYSSKDIAEDLADVLDARGVTGDREAFVNNRAKRAKDKLSAAVMAA